jgi:Histidine kinase-, DNA gyrase B-, and HSP90-like ATPase
METPRLGHYERITTMTTPTFRASSAPEEPAVSRADIIQVDTALQSMRDSGFDLTAAAGEPIDNSIEAGASLIRVLTRYGSNKASINQIAFADNGTGIDPGIVAHVLSMGYSTRYGERGSLGRFGVGVKLAGLSLGKRIDIYTKQVGSPAIWHSYIDLAEIASKKQTYIVAEQAAGWPAEYRDAMTGPDGEQLDSGTLVTFGKIDRLTSGGHYGTSLDQKLSDLRAFIARVYRRFLDKGLVIELNGNKVTLLDPLFLLDNPRIIDRYQPDDPRGVIIDEDDIEIGDHSIHVTVTTVPVEFRWKEGDGGSKDKNGRDIRDFQIPDSAGKISMVRNGREINYDNVAKLLPGGVDKVDRYIGIEVTFPAVLDEFFQVRNVKRGAVPVDKLRDELRKWLERPVRAARKEIRRHWGVVEAEEQTKKPEHEAAADAAARAEQTAPRGQAGRDYTDEQTERIINELLQDLGVQDDPQKAAEIRQQIKDKPMILVDGGWPGKEIFEITHLNGKAIVRLNHRHPFIRDIYDALKAAGNGGAEDLSLEDLVDLVRKTKRGLDVLFLAYAKGENMHRDPAKFDDLRSYWGQFTQSYLHELPTEE